jgi:hypothetical protein
MPVPDEVLGAGAADLTTLVHAAIGPAALPILTQQVIRGTVELVTQMTPSLRGRQSPRLLPVPRD